MPSTSRIPLTSITGHELAYASEVASKYAATVIAFVIEFTRAGYRTTASSTQASSLKRD